MGSYCQLVREKEGEESSDQEAGSLTKQLEEGVRKFRQKVETPQSLTLSELQNVRKEYSLQPSEWIAA